MSTRAVSTRPVSPGAVGTRPVSPGAVSTGAVRTGAVSTGAVGTGAVRTRAVGTRPRTTPPAGPDQPDRSAGRRRADDLAGAGLRQAVPADAGRAAGPLRRRSADAAVGAGVLDVSWRVLDDTPAGPLLLAVTSQGLVRLAFAGNGVERYLEELSARVSPRVLHAPSRLDPVAGQLADYFAGRLRRFHLPLDLRLAAGFRRTVLERLCDVGYGTTTSYAALARAAGSPRAVRATGSACAANPVAIVVPCHRVVRSDGSLGNYGGGVDAKARLLTLEGAV